MERVVKIKRLSELDIPRAIELSLLVFKPKEGEKERHHQPKKWKEHFRKGGVLLGAFVDNQLVGFIFGYEKEPGKETFHCWMGGVAEKYRQRGILKKLVRGLMKLLRQKGYKTLTLNTYPEKFPAMFAYLNKYNYEFCREEEADWDGRKVVKAFFQKKI